MVEFGTHEALMALKGRYSYLYSLQTDALADTPDSNINIEKKTDDNIRHGGEKSDDKSNTSNEGAEL